MTRSYRKASFSRLLEQCASPSRVPPPIRELPTGQTYQPTAQPPHSSPLSGAKPRVTNGNDSLTTLQRSKIANNQRKYLPHHPKRSKTTNRSRHRTTHHLAAGQNHDKAEEKPRLLALNEVKPRADHESTSLLSPSEAKPRSNRENALLTTSQRSKNAS